MVSKHACTVRSRRGSIATSILMLMALMAWPSAAQDAWNIEYVGGLPGYLEGVQVQGSD